jgi:hypothetical protein
MINGFEKYTYELNEYESNVCEIIVSKLRSNIGESKAVKNVEMRNKLESMGYKLQPARMRKIISFIRTNHLINNLVSTSKGYYVATKRQEVEKYIESLQQRINRIEVVKQSFKL